MQFEVSSCVFGVSVCRLRSSQWHSAARPQPNELLKEIIQPACEAGGESDSPRRGQPSLGKGKQMFGAHEVGDGGDVKVAPSDSDLTDLTDSSSVAPFAGSVQFWLSPQARLPRLGLSFSPPASRVHWMCFSNLSPTTQQRSCELARQRTRRLHVGIPAVRIPRNALQRVYHELI